MEIIYCNASNPFFILHISNLYLLQAIFKDGNLLPRLPVSCVKKIHVLHLTYKVALSQGRFTFHHDFVLRIIINNIRPSIKNFKSPVCTLKQPIKIKFEERGNRAKKQKFFYLRDITSGIKLGLVWRSRWYLFIST